MHWIFEILCTKLIATSNECSGDAAIISVTYLHSTDDLVGSTKQWPHSGR